MYTGHDSEFHIFAGKVFFIFFKFASLREMYTLLCEHHTSCTAVATFGSAIVPWKTSK